jgi:hypothetical protein
MFLLLALLTPFAGLALLLGAERLEQGLDAGATADKA